MGQQYCLSHSTWCTIIFQSSPVNKENETIKLSIKSIKVGTKMPNLGMTRDTKILNENKGTQIGFCANFGAKTSLVPSFCF
jgi:hypothetical protein